MATKSQKTIITRFLQSHFIAITLAIFIGLSILIIFQNKINIALINQAPKTNASFGATIAITQPSLTRGISPYIWGVNFESYSKYSNAQEFFFDISAESVQSLGIKAVRFPGGCGADFYDWKTSRLRATIRGTTYDKSFVSVNDALSIATTAGADLVYQINIEPYGGTDYCGAQNLTNNPDNRVQNAVDLVRNYPRIRVFEIGNEQWANWDPNTYATLAKNIANQMKQVDPTIKIGLIGFGSTDTTNNKTGWTNMVHQTITAQCGTVICFDFVTDHSYPTVGYNPLTAVNTNQFVMQSLLTSNFSNSFWNRSSYYRVCPIDTSSGIHFDSCTQWALDQHSTKGLPESQAYYNQFNPKTITAFTFTQNGQTQLRQSALSSDGHTNWYRTCPITALGPDWESCSAYASSDVSNLRHIGNERYGSFGAFVYKQRNAQGVLEEKLVQTFYSTDGRTSWRRVCPPTNISDTTCTQWAQGDLSNARGVGNESYGTFTAYVFIQNGQQQLQQALYSLDLRTAWVRTCPIDDSAGPFVLPCTGWSAPIDTTTTISLGGESYSGVSAFVFNAQQSYGLPNSATRGAAANYPRTNYENVFSALQSNYAPLPVALTEWNLSCGDNPPGAPSRSIGTVDHGLFVAESLLRMAQHGYFMANYHDFTKSSLCGLFDPHGTHTASGEAFSLTSALARDTLYNAAVTDPSGSLTAVSGVNLDRTRLDVMIVNRNESQDANVTLTIGNLADMVLGSNAQTKTVSSLSYTDSSFERQKNPVVAVTNNTVPLSLPSLSITYVQIPLSPAPIPIPSPPASISAVCNTSGTAATISWSASKGATVYPLRINNTGYPWQCPPAAGNPYDRCLDVTGTSYALTPVQPNKQYLMWVHAANSSGGSQATSGTFTCTAPTPTPSPSPTHTPSPTPTPSPSPTPIRSPSPTPTRSPSPTPTNSPTPTPIAGDFGCTNQSFYTVANLKYSYTKDCLSVPRQMYLNDPRFTIFFTPADITSIPFIKTDNVAPKEDQTLSWSVNLTYPSTVYVFYRKIPGQTAPAWLKSDFTKVTNDDYSNLQQFLLRKNDQGLIGVYDIYKKSPLFTYDQNGNAHGGVTLGPATDNSVTAFSMYLVGVKPLPYR